MAINIQRSPDAAAGSMSSRRVLIGGNVVLMIVLAIGVVAALQFLGFKYGRKFDWSSSGINSLSIGTENLLKELPNNVRITSAYFKTDIEDDDQSKFRNAVDDLINLFQSTNRTKVTAASFNPIHDHEAQQKLVDRLSKLSGFAEEAKPYQAAIDKFNGELSGQMLQVVQDELNQVNGVLAAAAEVDANIVTEVRRKLEDLVQDLNLSREDVADATGAKPPNYTTAVSVLRNVYRNVGDWLKKIGEFGKQQAARTPDLSDVTKEYLNSVGDRVDPLVKQLESEQAALPSSPLELDQILDGLDPTRNSIIVETDESARLVSFSDVWPPANPEMPSSGVKFSERAFEGERQLASAILQLTQKEKSAVIFVRFGGQPLVEPSGMPGATEPPMYRQLKVQLEDLNFDVYEWDLSAGVQQPTYDPEPTKKIFVVFKPEEQNPFEQQRMPKPQWGPQHLKALEEAMGTNGRAFFMAGWFPGAFGGAIPATYPFDDFLKTNFGITVEHQTLIIANTSLPTGKWMPARPSPVDLTEFEVPAAAAEHPIVKRIGSLHACWPWSAPIIVADPLPEGVKATPMIALPAEEGLWGVKDIQNYQQRISAEGMDPSPDDLRGPFTIAVAAEKGEQKVIVTAARDFATDRYMKATGIVPTAQGFAIRQIFPANQTFLFNCLHWLNDDVSRMELGRPLDAGVLTVAGESTLRNVKVFAFAIWPAIALICGIVAWMVRRS